MAQTAHGKAFISKLSDAESEAAETQVWLEFAVHCGYTPREHAIVIYRSYDEVIRMIVGMINHPEVWLIDQKASTLKETPEEYGDPF